jgi:hypothetical protein
MSLKWTEEGPATGRLAAYQRAADDAGMSRHAWCLAILDAASGRSALPEQLARVVRLDRMEGEW